MIYRAAGGYNVFAIIVLLSISVEVTRVIISYWLSAWSGNDYNLSTGGYIAGYIIGNVTNIIVSKNNDE